MSPILILLIGIAVVVVMILVLRANAFLALIGAALVVSMLADGDWAVKGERVALALGTATGKIGIVIAMAAIIGICMMRSGAAEKIVIAFCRLLGEKRFPLALCGSGFVLSIPVFYDTVFFLLIPLARSFYKRVRKNYILCIMAICAGAMITHTMVPPTPGPLAIASNMGIDIGQMMMLGLLVGALIVPFALAGAYLIQWYMPNPKIHLPASDLAEDTQDITLEDEQKLADREKQLPSLGWSMLPVLLPIILIALGSYVNMMYITNITMDDQAIILNEVGGIEAVVTKEKQLEVTIESVEFQAIIKPENMLKPQAIKQSALPFWANIAITIGGKEIAMMLAAALSMLVYYRQKIATAEEMRKDIESALLDAGAIILITAAGGAFGSMLQLAGIGGSIEAMFQNESGISGLSVLIGAFCVASVLKLSLGSSTTAMLTASSIFGAMGLTTESLGFNLAYLGLTISCGSLVTSWMNDSGFWLTSRMAGLSETDTLKSVTVLHIVVGCSGFAIILALSQLLPLTNFGS